MSRITEKFQLSADQSRVIESLMDWLQKKPTLHITVGGYAGTGKTTLASVLRLLIHERTPQKKVAFGCYTGKASQVLKQKLTANNALYANDFCGTIHSLMYTAVTDDDGKILLWRRNSELPYDLIIIDEASMVTSDIWNDLLKYGLPIIAIGDHGQLPPIDSAFNLMETPELRLEKIHRQAEGNPIIEIATLARETGKIPFRSFSTDVLKVDRQTEDVSELLQQWVVPYSKDTLVLCARNKTRIQLNKHIRSLIGYEEEMPQIGETVICLKNNYESAGGPIYNGMLGKVKRIEAKYIHWYDIDIEFHDEDRLFSGEVSQHQFFQEKTIDSVKGLHYTRIGDRFDFGYALTVHKAQGSQAKSVVVFEEYAPYMTDEEWRRWLYTAVTRASDRLLIIR
jgi:exodeoxyribonuclease V